TVNNGGLLGILDGRDKILKAFFARLNGNRQRTFYGLQLPIDGKLSHYDKLLMVVGLALLGSSKNAICKGEVVIGSFLAQIGWRHVDDDFLSRYLVTVVLQGSGNAEIALLDGIVRKPYQMIANTVINIDFYGDGSGFYSKDGTAENFSQHGWVVWFNNGK